MRVRGRGRARVCIALLCLRFLCLFQRLQTQQTLFLLSPLRENSLRGDSQNRGCLRLCLQKGVE